MSETEDLLAIHGAVDIAVQDSGMPQTRPRVAALIPLYDSPKVHWYREFLKWREDEGVELPPSVGETDQSVALALESLAGTPPGSNRMAARRLLALWALAQARMDDLGPRGDLSEGVQGAIAAVLSQRLDVATIGVRRVNEAARRLQEFMAQDILVSGGQDADENWSMLVSQVQLYVYINGLEQRACTSTFQARPDGRPVPTLESVFDVRDVDFEYATTFLDPGKWPLCMDFWCEMEPDPNAPVGINRYNEVVSSDCEDPANAVFTARAVLDFTFPERKNAMHARYDLAPGRPMPGDDVTVDTGVLVVQQMPGFLRIKTTKTVEFSRVFLSDQLAAIGCALGWTDKGKAMMYNCARLPKNGFQDAARHDPLTVSGAADFPARVAATPPRSGVKHPTGTSRRSTPGAANTGSQQGATNDDGSVLADIARETGQAIKDCVDDQAAYMEKWADRVADDEYGYKDMLDDIARASVRMVVDSARITNLAVRNAEIASAPARARRTEPPAGTGGPGDEGERQ